VGQLVDGQGGVRKDVVVTVEGSQIKSIAKATGAKHVTYSFPKLTLMPGMIDTHVHIDSHFGSNGRIANPLEEPATSKSIRERGEKTMSDEQIAAACQEAKALGKRTWVHAHSAESVRASVLGGCSAIAHGAYATEEEFKLMAERGVYFEPTSRCWATTTSPTRTASSARRISRRTDSSFRKRPSPSSSRCSRGR